MSGSKVIKRPGPPYLPPFPAAGTGFRFWTREKWNESEKNNNNNKKKKDGGGRGEERKRLQTNPRILKTSLVSKPDWLS